MFSNIKVTEKYISQLPAMQALIAFGYTPLSQDELKKKRRNLKNVLLEDILVEKNFRI